MCPVADQAQLQTTLKASSLNVVTSTSLDQRQLAGCHACHSGGNFVHPQQTHDKLQRATHEQLLRATNHFLLGTCNAPANMQSSIMVRQSVSL